MSTQDYKSLADVLDLAYERASKGKGKERHGEGKPFTDQYICRGGRRYGVAALQYQIGKKCEELSALPTIEQKINELLDIIVYASTAVIVLKEQDEKRQSEILSAVNGGFCPKCGHWRPGLNKEV